MAEKEFANDVDRAIFGKRIRSLRENRKLSREDLADLCHISLSHMRQIETGERLPSVPVLIILCNQLKVSPSYLFQEELTFLTDELPDPYDRLMRMVLKRSPEEADMLVAVMELMASRMK